MNKTNSVFLTLCLTAFLFSAFSLDVQAQTKKKTTAKGEILTPQLMADRVTVKTHLSEIDSTLLSLEIGEGEEEFPADDLYDGSWDNRFVSAGYKDAVVPDSFTIDLTSFVMPIESRITSHFGYRRRGMHYGTDLKVQVGDTIRAAFDGKIRVKYYERKGYGYYLVLRHPNGLETVYGHLSRFLVDVDDVVKAGQPIALGGNTGRSTGPHLHFEFRFLGKAINPEKVIDFENNCTFDEFYVFHKAESGKAINKYTAKAGNGQVTYHRIRKGDTLGKISRTYHVSIDELCRLNGIKRTSILREGKTLRCS